MPRGKYVNHKGRSRHFTSPEELQQEKDESSDGSTSSGEGGEGEEGAAAKVRTKKPKTRVAAKKAAGVVSSSEEDSDEEESSEDDRDARKGVASLIEIENPNRVVKKATQKVSNLTLDDGGAPSGGGGGGGAAGAAGGGGAAAKPELSRREREQIEKQKARARYEKLHAAGKTSEAKSDLARLALIRQQRADAAAKRDADKKAAEERKGGGKA